MSIVPAEVTDAMQLSDELYDPILRAFKALAAGQQSLVSQHEAVVRNINTASTLASRETLDESRDRRSAP